MGINWKKILTNKYLFLLLLFLSPFVCCIPYFNTQASTLNALTLSVTNISKKNDYGKAYSVTEFVKSDGTPSSQANAIFQSEYGMNFNNNFVEIMSYIDGDSIFEMSVSCNNAQLNNTKYCDAYTYSNQEKLKRFECLNINLFKTPNKSEELNTYTCDGFVYIPDYFANIIISESEGELHNYNDLLPTLSDLSQEKRDEFLQKYSVHVTNNNGLDERYKIANIFHVEGFDDKYGGEYLYNDDNSGKFLEQFLGNYVFAYTNTHYFKQFSKCLIAAFDAKRFFIQERIEAAYTRSLNDDVYLRFYSVNNQNNNELINANSSIKKCFAIKTSSGAISSTILLFLFTATGGFICFLRISKKFFYNRNETIIVFVIFGLIFIIFSILTNTIFASNIFFLRLFNVFFYIDLLVSLLLFSTTCVFKKVTCNE